MGQVVRQVGDGEELVLTGPPDQDSEDPREQMLENRRLAFDHDFDQDFERKSSTSGH